MIRPQAKAALARHFETGLALGVCALGIFWLFQGGYVLGSLGAVTLAMAAPWVVLARRRARFTQTVASTGLIEVVEGELRFYAPDDAGGPQTAMGGFLNLPDLVELRLIHMRDRRFWRMKTHDGQALMVPVDAAGHDALFDVFAALPGMDDAALIAALGLPPATAAATQTLWRRPGGRASPADAT